MEAMRSQARTPLDAVERLFDDLVSQEADDDARALHAATKLLLLALSLFRAHGGPSWQVLLDEYVDIAQQDPDGLERMLDSNRSRPWAKRRR
jgi:hypothetical protein